MDIGKCIEWLWPEYFSVGGAVEKPINDFYSLCNFESKHCQQRPNEWQ